MVLFCVCTSSANEKPQLELATTAKRQNAIILAAKALQPSVVSISALQSRSGSAVNPLDEYFRNFFHFPYGSNRFGSRNKPVQNLGSGLIINPEGYIISNEHVVGGASAITVTTSTGIELEAEIVGADKLTDIAVIKASTSEPLSAAALGSSNDLMIGEWVVAIGNPFGNLLTDPSPTVTAGVISALHRDIRPDKNRVQVYWDMIQTDASINPGNSGGPLANVLGQVIGINTFIFTRGGGSLGIGFAIPINRAKKIAFDIIKYGETRQAWTGMEVTEKVTRMENKRFLVVSEIEKDSPAAEAGVREGDIIISIEKIPVTDKLSFLYRLETFCVGDSITLDIKRRNREYSLSLELEPLPQHYKMSYIPELECYLRQVDAQLATKHHLISRHGVVISELDQSSFLYRTGVRKGDMIIAAGRYRIKSVRDIESVIDLYASPALLVLSVERSGAIYFVEVVLTKK